MIKILITGQNSYIGTSFQEWLKLFPDQYYVDTIDMKDLAWRNVTFSGYDAVLHTAGIAHVDTTKATQETKELYYRVNRDLTIEAARKAKEDGVKQFLFMSSIIVYGESSSLKEKKVITMNTTPSPTNYYGDSKLQAEEGIMSLQSDDFRIVVLRPPMIYGKGSKGNYPKLSSLARRTWLFPDIYNERSMLHIDNLCEFIRLMIDNEESGVFYPQNEEYTCTSELVRMIAKAHGRELRLTSIFNPVLIKILPKNIRLKVFGSLVYDMAMSQYKVNYRVHKYKDTIRMTEI